MKLTSKEFKPVLDLLAAIGTKLIAWQNDLAHRKIHSKKDFKTEADRQAHQFLKKGLSSLFPGVPVISEEDISHSDKRPEEYWLIDPIDGTASWYNGFDGFVSQAALMVNGRPIFGVIHSPRMGATWSAEIGRGAFLNEVLLPKLRKRDRLMFVDNTPFAHGITKQIMNHLGTNLYLECGSIGLKSVLVADGTVDAFVKDVLVRDWDLAPADIILSEVGGSICLLNGEKYIYSGSYEKENGFIVSRDSSLMMKIVSLQI
jgi:fructose-1,6-bisphosphatase/inositol monophosphatase family enzyme